MKVKCSKFDIFVEVVCIGLLCSIVLYLLMQWNQFPKEIPGHYNASGVVDRMTDKSSLIILTLVNVFLYCTLTIVMKFPQIWNTGVSVNEHNKEAVYRIIKTMLGSMKLFIVMIFCYLTWMSSTANALPTLFLPVFLFVLFGNMIYHSIRLFRVNKQKKLA